jgi:isoamylase
VLDRLNGWWEPLTFTMLAAVSTPCWQIVCDTYDPARIGVVVDRHYQ